MVAPAAGKFAGEAGYLATALAPGLRPGEVGLLAPKVIGESGPGRRSRLEAYRVIVLCGASLAGGLRGVGSRHLAPPGGVRELRRRVARLRRRRGQPGQLQPPGLRRRQGHPFPVDWANPSATPPTARVSVQLQPESFTHPAVAGLTGAERSGLFAKGRVYRFFPVEPHPTAATVVMRYADGHPAVLERSFGSGRVCLVTTTASMKLEQTWLPAGITYR